MNLVRVRDHRGSEFWADLDRCPWVADALQEDTEPDSRLWRVDVAQDDPAPQYWAVIRSAVVTLLPCGRPVDLSKPCNWGTARRISLGEVQAEPAED